MSTVLSLPLQYEVPKTPLRWSLVLGWVLRGEGKGAGEIYIKLSVVDILTLYGKLYHFNFNNIFIICSETVLKINDK